MGQVEDHLEALHREDPRRLKRYRKLDKSIRISLKLLKQYAFDMSIVTAREHKSLGLETRIGLEYWRAEIMIKEAMEVLASARQTFIRADKLYSDAIEARKAGN